MLKNRDKWLEVLQFTGLAMMLVGLALSNFLMSLSTIWLSGVFLLFLLNDFASGKKVSDRLFGFFSTRYALLFASVYLLFVIGMLWSADWQYGLKDLKTKLPLLVMPLVITSLNPISQKAYRSLLRLFIFSLIVATFICLSVYWGVYNSFAARMHWKLRDVNDIRDISIFISHIRFSLLLVVGICILFTRFFTGMAARFISVLISIFFLYFLWVVESITGFSILLALIFVLLLYLVFTARRKWIRISGMLSFVAIAVLLVLFCYFSYREYYTTEPIDFQSLDEFTVGGERYEHHPESHQLENGRYVMIYIAWGEMAEAWRGRSKIDIESTDASGNPLKGTLLRYLTSMGLHKDRQGVMALSDADVKQIEAGIPSVTWQRKNGIERRVERILFEYNNYINGGNPSGHSVFQRLEFWRAGYGIARDNPFFGVGTGDVAQAFNEEYEKMNSRLDKTHWLRTHNQYLTVWISNGLFGLAWFLFVLVYPVTRKEYRSNKLYMSFWLTAILSFFTEDTLESQAGISFYVFLTCFLIFLPRKEVGVSKPFQD